jgi:hypothetical protein
MTGRWTYWTSAAGVIVLAAAAFTLSYDALHQLALDSRVRPTLAWLWPVVIDGTIVVALLTVLAANRAATRAAYSWALAGLFSAASVAFNIAHAPDRPVAQLVFAMAPIALVLTTHLLMQQAGWRRATPDPTAPGAEQQAGPEAAQPHRSGDHPASEPQRPDREAQIDVRSRIRAAYEAQLAAEQTPTGAGLARAAGVSERYGQRLLAEFTADPTGPAAPTAIARFRSPASDRPQRPQKGGKHGKAIAHRRGNSRGPRNRPQQGLRAATGRRHPVGADRRLPANPGGCHRRLYRAAAARCGRQLPQHRGEAPAPLQLLQRRFYPLLERAGLPRIRFHDLRHSAATLLLGLGIHPKIVSEMLGHSQIAITLDLYSHVTATMQQEAVRAFEGLLGIQVGSQEGATEH